MPHGKRTIIFSFLFALLFAGPVFGQETIEPTAPEPRIRIPGLDFTSPENLVDSVRQTGTGERQTLIHIPYLAEYITAIYRYAVAVASIVAVVMIIISGIQWTASGGNTDTISSAKKRITNAVTGLILALGSYTLLYTINPQLVQFQSLKIIFVNTVDVDFFDKGEFIDPDLEKDVQSRIPSSYRGTRRAVAIAIEGDAGAKRLGLYVPGSWEINTGRGTFSEGCPLGRGKNLSQIGASIPAPPRTNTRGNPSDGTFDPLFKAYGKCLPIAGNDGWKILKGLSAVESRHQATARNQYNFVGLFQTKDDFCRRGYLERHKMDGFCSDLEDPEVSTMVGTASIVQSVETIRVNCGSNLPKGSDLLYFIFIGHRNGTGALQQILLRSGCDRTRACLASYQVWNSQRGYDDDAPDGEVISACR